MIACRHSVARVADENVKLISTGAFSFDSAPSAALVPAVVVPVLVPAAVDDDDDDDDDAAVVDAADDDDDDDSAAEDIDIAIVTDVVVAVDASAGLLGDAPMAPVSARRGEGIGELSISGCRALPMSVSLDTDSSFSSACAV
jgi:hypothetical protein